MALPGLESRSLDTSLPQEYELSECFPGGVFDVDQITPLGYQEPLEAPKKKEAPGWEEEESY